MFAANDNGGLAYYSKNQLSNDLHPAHDRVTEIEFMQGVINQNQQNCIKSYHYCDTEDIVETKYYLSENFNTSKINVNNLVTDILGELVFVQEQVMQSIKDEISQFIEKPK